MNSASRPPVLWKSKAQRKMWGALESGAFQQASGRVRHVREKIILQTVIYRLFELFQCCLLPNNFYASYNGSWISEALSSLDGVV